MEDNQKNQALKQKIEDPEKQATGERQEAATSLEKLEHQHEAKALKDRQLPEQEVRFLRANNSYFDKKYISSLQKLKLLEGVFKDERGVTFDEYISIEADKVAQLRVKAIQEETETRIKALQSRIDELLAENKLVKESNAFFNNIIPITLEEMENLEARVSTLTMEIEKSSAKIQELETARD
eukprot:CAMPEP_0175051184 /NCGR_PEP_ID=MMETSP0052_2-20121109/7654_1 /TAXON_ID=51329 ORGANISM="Polytomella parva, Strain SAG 63-3" /NCGR_SAMPLE_ID=MMETSP0052_2 /ASSEMBLY_ACC=CAM_ASM_000194 /LENGTH=181 /DNA_ID=CAMNT_0016315431 /DNA_START=10 /DNA_END=552 /DNA_ORIENTATION=-